MDMSALRPRPIDPRVQWCGTHMQIGLRSLHKLYVISAYTRVTMTLETQSVTLALALAIVAGDFSYRLHSLGFAQPTIKSQCQFACGTSDANSGVSSMSAVD
jgi:hypothetical protein